MMCIRHQPALSQPRYALNNRLTFQQGRTGCVCVCVSLSTEALHAKCNFHLDADAAAVHTHHDSRPSVIEMTLGSYLSCLSSEQGYYTCRFTADLAVPASSPPGSHFPCATPTPTHLTPSSHVPQPMSCETSSYPPSPLGYSIEHGRQGCTSSKTARSCRRASRAATAWAVLLLGGTCPPLSENRSRCSMAKLSAC